MTPADAPKPTDPTQTSQAETGRSETVGGEPQGPGNSGSSPTDGSAETAAVDHEVEQGGIAVATAVAPVTSDSETDLENKPADKAGALSKIARRPGWLSKIQQNKALFFGTGAAAIILGAGAAAYVTQRSTGPAPQQSLSLVPEEAIATLRFTDDSSQWESLRKIGTPSLQIGLGKWLALGRDRITNLGYGDWKTLQSQIDGKPTLALIPTGEPAPPPVPGLRGNTAPPDLLVVVPVKNPGPIKREIANIEPPEGFENRTSSHRGVEIFEIQADFTQRHHIAIVGSFWVMASNRDTVTRAIDSFYNGESLAKSEDFRETQKQLGKGDAFMDLYLNTPAAVQAAAAAGRLLPLPSDVQGLAAQINLVDNGFSVQSLTTQMPKGQSLGLLAPNKEKTEPVNLTAAFGDRFPSSTSLLLSGSSLRDAWISHSQSNSTSPIFSATALREQINAVTSMDLDKDWLSWMDGSYSVGILPISSRANSRFQTGLTVMVQTSNRRLAERSLKKLDSLMVNKYRMRLNTGTLAGQPVVNWSSATGEPIVTHGWLDGNVAFLIVGAPGANSLLPQPRATLATSPLFREGMPRTEQELPTGQMFVDVDRVSKTNLISLLPLPTGTKPFIDALKSVGAERRVIDEELTRYDLSFQFLRSFAPPIAPTPEAESESAAPTPTPATPTTEAPSTDDAAPDAADISSPTESPEPATDEVTIPDADASERSATPTPAQPTPLMGAQPEAASTEAAPSDPSDTPEPATLEQESPRIDAPTTQPSGTPEILGPVLPRDPYDREVQGPKLPRPSENPWTDSFIDSSRTPIAPKVQESPEALTESEPAADESKIAAPEVLPEARDLKEATVSSSQTTVPSYLRPSIPLGPELPQTGDRYTVGPQRPSE